MDSDIGIHWHTLAIHPRPAPNKATKKLGPRVWLQELCGKMHHLSEVRWYK